MSRYIKNISTRAEFKNVLKEGTIIIVKASADWCGPCKKIAPLVKKLFETMPKNVWMLEVDVDDDQDLATFFDIKQVPTFISYIGKDKMDVAIGGNEKTVRAFFQKIEGHMAIDNLSTHLYGEEE